MAVNRVRNQLSCRINDEYVAYEYVEYVEYEG